MCHHTTPPRTDAVAVTPEERRVLACIITRALAWAPLTESEHRALKGFFMKVCPSTEAAE